MNGMLHWMVQTDGGLDGWWTATLFPAASAKEVAEWCSRLDHVTQRSSITYVKFLLTISFHFIRRGIVLSRTKFFSCRTNTIPCCKKHHWLLGRYGHKGRKTHSVAIIIPQPLSSCGASLKWRSLRVDGSITERQHSKKPHMDVQIQWMPELFEWSDINI